MDFGAIIKSMFKNFSLQFFIAKYKNTFDFLYIVFISRELSKLNSGSFFVDSSEFST